MDRVKTYIDGFDEALGGGIPRGSVVLVALCFVAVLAIAVTTYLTLSSRAMNFSARTYNSSLSAQLAEIGMDFTLPEARDMLKKAGAKVDGERVTMHPGDFIITPSDAWHDHGHDGEGPYFWLDGLDIPIVALFDAQFAENYPQDAQPVTTREGTSIARYGSNLAPLEPLPDKGEGLELRLLVKLRVQNPNSTAISYEGASVKVEVQDRTFASGVSNVAGTVGGFSETIVEVPVTMSMFRMFRHAMAMKDGVPAGPIRYSMSGKLHGASMFGTQRFQSSGEFELPQGAPAATASDPP